MSVWMILCLALALVKEGFGGLASDKQGPYDIRVRFIEDCSEGDNTTVPIKFYPKMQRIDRNTLAVSGTVVLHIPVDDELKWTIAFDQKTSQGYKENFFYTDFQKKPLCTGLQEFGDENDYKKLFSAIIKDDENRYTGCPIEVGTHAFEMGAMVEAFKKVPTFFYNTYRISTKLYRDLSKSPDGCLRIVADFIPKRKKTG